MAQQTRWLEVVDGYLDLSQIERAYTLLDGLSHYTVMVGLTSGQQVGVMGGYVTQAEAFAVIAQIIDNDNTLSVT